MSEGRVLVVDDEPQIRRALRRVLAGHGYEVALAEGGEAALDVLATGGADAVVLDLMMPDMDGFEVLRRVRAWSAVPIVVLSARGEEDDKVAALDLGADDYLTKPFGIRELLARLRAVRRRPAPDDAEPLVVGDVVIDLARRLVTRGGQRVNLTRTEYVLLTALANDAGRVLTHPRLVELVWGAYGPGSQQEAQQLQRLRVYINRLRHKLEADPRSPRMILSESGVGYRLWTEG
jgi:two-component system KDP operon response regulator KdpE